MSEQKIPRPRNAFILFRQHHHRLLIDEWTAQGVDIPHNSKISKILGVRWRGLSDQERSHWEEQARKEKCEHEKKYPDYRYKPMRRHKRKGGKQFIPQQGSPPQLAVQMNIPQNPQQQFQTTRPQPAPLSTVTKVISSPVQQVHSGTHTATNMGPQLTPMHNLLAPGHAAGQLRPLPYPAAPTTSSTGSATPTPVYQPYYLPLHGYLPKFTQVPSSQVAQATPPQPPPGATGAPPSLPSSLPSSLPPALAISSSSSSSSSSSAVVSHIPTNSVTPATTAVSQAGGAAAVAGTFPFYGAERPSNPNNNSNNWQWRSYAHPFDRR